MTLSSTSTVKLLPLPSPPPPPPPPINFQCKISCRCCSRLVNFIKLELSLVEVVDGGGNEGGGGNSNDSTTNSTNHNDSHNAPWWILGGIKRRVMLNCQSNTQVLVKFPFLLSELPIDTRLVISENGRVLSEINLFHKKHTTIHTINNSTKHLFLNSDEQMSLKVEFPCFNADIVRYQSAQSKSLINSQNSYFQVQSFAYTSNRLLVPTISSTNEVNGDGSGGGHSYAAKAQPERSLRELFDDIINKIDRYHHQSNSHLLLLHKHRDQLWKWRWWLMLRHRERSRWLVVFISLIVDWNSFPPSSAAAQECRNSWLKVGCLKPDDTHQQHQHQHQQHHHQHNIAPGDFVEWWDCLRLLSPWMIGNWWVRGFAAWRLGHLMTTMTMPKTLRSDNGSGYYLADDTHNQQQQQHQQYNSLLLLVLQPLVEALKFEFLLVVKKKKKTTTTATATATETSDVDETRFDRRISLQTDRHQLLLVLLLNNHDDDDNDDGDGNVGNNNSNSNSNNDDDWLSCWKSSGSINGDTDFRAFVADLWEKSALCRLLVQAGRSSAVFGNRLYWYLQQQLSSIGSYGDKHQQLAEFAVYTAVLELYAGRLGVGSVGSSTTITMPQPPLPSPSILNMHLIQHSFLNGMEKLMLECRRLRLSRPKKIEWLRGKLFELLNRTGAGGNSSSKQKQLQQHQQRSRSIVSSLGLFNRQNQRSFDSDDDDLAFTCSLPFAQSNLTTTLSSSSSAGVVSRWWWLREWYEWMLLTGRNNQQSSLGESSSSSYFNPNGKMSFFGGLGNMGTNLPAKIAIVPQTVCDIEQQPPSSSSSPPPRPLATRNVSVVWSNNAFATLSNNNNNHQPLILPLNASYELIGLVPEESLLFKSQLMPMRLSFICRHSSNNHQETRNSTPEYNTGMLPAPNTKPKVLLLGDDGNEITNLKPKHLNHHHQNSQNPTLFKYSLLFKLGDDLRQDHFVMQMISLMNQCLLEDNIDLKIITYQVLACGQADIKSPPAGLVEFVDDAVPLSWVLEKFGSSSGVGTVAGSTGASTITQQPTSPPASRTGSSLRAYWRNCRREYLRKQFGEVHPELDSDRIAMEELEDYVDPDVIDTWVKSCAGYSVITYLLGVGDRHLDNLMVTPQGHLFHIDFSYILGNDPKPFPPPMKLCREMIDAMGGSGFQATSAAPVAITNTNTNSTTSRLLSRARRNNSSSSGRNSIPAHNYHQSNTAEATPSSHIASASTSPTTKTPPLSPTQALNSHEDAPNVTVPSESALAYNNDDGSVAAAAASAATTNKQNRQKFANQPPKKSTQFQKQQSIFHHRFKSLCCAAFISLRNKSHLFTCLMHMMIKSGVGDIAIEPDRAVEKFEQNFRLDLPNDEQAIQFMHQLIDESFQALVPQLMETVHKWAQYWRK